MNTTQPRPHSPDLLDTGRADSASTDAARTDSAHSPDRLAETVLGRDRGILMDLLGILPAPTLSRELFALVVNLAAVGVLIAVIQPSTLVATVIVAIAVTMVLSRLVAGFLARGYARSLPRRS